MTNADKIRAMTDEELMRMLAVHYDCFCCPSNCSAGMRAFAECEHAMLDWLKQEVSDNG